MTDKIFLIDLLKDAEIQAISENYVEIQSMNQERQTRSAIFQHPDSTIRFRSVCLGSHPKFSFETGIAESVRERFEGVVFFSINIFYDGKEESLLKVVYRPKIILRITGGILPVLTFKNIQEKQ